MKFISQETFDSVILENVKDFDYSLEEAVKEAVKEFEAQGVQLTNIVKNPKISEDKMTIKHELLESLSSLRKGNRTLPSKDTISYLRSIEQQCKLSLAHRVLATKNDGYKVLLKIISESKENPQVLVPALDAMAALTITNPDILEEEGVKVMVELLASSQSSQTDNKVHESLAKWCLQNCLKHEKNRQYLVQLEVPTLLISLLDSNRNCGAVAKAICRALRAFTFDDDIRTEFGKAHDHARLLVEEHNLIELCLEIVKGYLQEVDVVSEFLSTLNRVCVRAEYCQDAVDKGALAVINDILISFPDNPVLNQQAIILLKTISGNDKVKEEVMKIGAGQLIVGSLVKHQSSVGVCEAACGAISMLALRVPSHAKHLIQLGASDAITQAMKNHPKVKQIQTLGCMAVRNLVARVPENRALLIECQIEDVIHTALRNFESDSSLKDVAKAALRDLDLRVKLEEQWRGTGTEIGR